MGACQRRLAIMLCVAIALASLAVAASARRLSISPVQGFRVVATAAEFISSNWIEERSSEEFVIRCPMTLTGSFSSSTFAKVPGAQIGSLTGATVSEAECRTVLRVYEEGTFRESASEGRLQVLTETLPWRVNYRAFGGTLPTITLVRVDVVGAHLRIYSLPGGIACLYASSAMSPMRYLMLVSRGTFGRFDGEESSPRVPLVEGSPFCFATGLGFANAGQITQAESASSLSVTLI